MKSKFFSVLTKAAFVLLACTSVAPVASHAADGSKEKFDLINSAQLKEMMASTTAKVAVFDANNSNTRTKEGIIPGAKLLTSFNDYNVATELPADKSTHVVFYCANTRCTASHAAAERAAEAGFAHVSVMSDGIQGWKAAGLHAEAVS